MWAPPLPLSGSAAAAAPAAGLMACLRCVVAGIMDPLLVEGQAIRCCCRVPRAACVMGARLAPIMLQGVVTRVSQPEPGAGGYPTATIQMTDIMERGRTKVASFCAGCNNFPAKCAPQQEQLNCGVVRRQEREVLAVAGRLPCPAAMCQLPTACSLLPAVPVCAEAARHAAAGPGAALCANTLG